MVFELCLSEYRSFESHYVYENVMKAVKGMYYRLFNRGISDDWPDSFTAPGSGCLCPLCAKILLTYRELRSVFLCQFALCHLKLSFLLLWASSCVTLVSSLELKVFLTPRRALKWVFWPQLWELSPTPIYSAMFLTCVWRQRYVSSWDLKPDLYRFLNLAFVFFCFLVVFFINFK